MRNESKRAYSVTETKEILKNGVKTFPFNLKGNETPLKTAKKLLVAEVGLRIPRYRGAKNAPKSIHLKFFFHFCSFRPLFVD